jgi:hypothetical protein
MPGGSLRMSTHPRAGDCTPFETHLFGDLSVSNPLCNRARALIGVCIRKLRGRGRGTLERGSSQAGASSPSLDLARNPSLYSFLYTPSLPRTLSVTLPLALLSRFFLPSIQLHLHGNVNSFPPQQPRPVEACTPESAETILF